jgi:glycosyltransferase involved in cell wall biosynthesis
MLWAVSERIKQVYRQVYGIQCPILVVPGGTKNYPAISDTKTNNYRLAFLGNLDEFKGLQLAVQALPEIKKYIPEVKLIVVGDGPYHNNLVKLVDHLGVRHDVEFVGHIPNHQKAMQMVAQCDIGLATYVPDLKNISMYGFPLKIIEYLAAGLPVITTKVSEWVHKLSVMNAGIIIDYDVKSFVNAVTFLLSDESRLQLYKENALRLGREYSWDRIFNQAMIETIKTLTR